MTTIFRFKIENFRLNQNGLEEPKRRSFLYYFRLWRIVDFY